MEKIKIGVFGAGRGMDIARNFMLLGCDIVALCDNHDERREAAAAKLDKSCAIYDNFDAFIEHDMDAVIVANYFHEHARYSIRLIEKGIHVFSECISNGTMAEGVELVEAFEKCNAVYMLAENYPQMLFNREIKRICDGGTLGKFLYAEGEYNHPTSPFDTAFKKRYNYFEGHWRNYVPRAYYVTHSMGPIMWATGATPKKVTAFGIFDPETNENAPTACNVGDGAAVITTQNDDGSVFRFTGCAKYGAHHNAYRVCGVNGQIENLRGMDGKVMLRYNSWSKPTPETPEESLYLPDWNDADEEIIKTSGHGGGDYLTARMFLDCIRENRQPEHPFDIYSAVNMSSVAILAHRSILNGGETYDIPDFRTKDGRDQYRDDRETPFYGENGMVPTIPCCTHPDYKPTAKQIELFNECIK